MTDKVYLVLLPFASLALLVSKPQNLNRKKAFQNIINKHNLRVGIKRRPKDNITVNAIMEVAIKWQKKNSVPNSLPSSSKNSR